MKPYKPQKDSFPARTIAYLQKHGESKACEIRKAIGLNDYVNTTIYKDRACYYFDILLRRLVNRGVILRTKHGHYKIK